MVRRQQGRIKLAKSISPGGQAALTGFLYQITRTLSQALEHSVIVRSTDISGGDATLILEPPDGGDLVFETVRSAYVEQHKSRSTPKPWNATEIISQVLPDLWAAENQISSKYWARYSFVTDGRGPSSSFTDFLKACKVVSQPKELSEDSSQTVRAFGQKYNHHTLFELIAARLNGASQQRGRLLRLLQHLDIVAEAKLEDFETKIDSFLAGLAEETVDVERKRHELIGRLFRLSSEGGAITAIELLKDCDLPIERLKVGIAAPARFSKNLTSDLKRIGYDSEVDVRVSPPMLPDTAVILLKGESGTGKSWLVARWADELRDCGLSALIMRDVTSADEVTEVLNRLIWQGAGFSRPTDISTISRKIRNDQPKDILFWLTVFLDDPKPACLESFARQDYASLGIRIVVVSAQINDELMHRVFGFASAISTPLFTLGEAKTLLVKHGSLSEDGWRALPSDIMLLMRRPMAAFLYRETAGVETFDPRTEYELMERYWQSLQDRPILHPGDAEYLDVLILSWLDDPSLYPWPFALVNKHIPDHVRKRLMLAGILQATSNAWILEHDRVLNWAAAQALFKNQNGGAASINCVAERFARLRSVDAAAGMVSWRLGYLLMDTFAIALKTRPHSDVLTLLHNLSNDRRQRDLDDAFYTSLLPTLGTAALPVYESALRDREPRERPLPHDLAKGIINVSKSDKASVVQWCGRLLSHEDKDSILTALLVGTEIPLTEYIELVWQRHTEISIMHITGTMWPHDMETSGMAFDQAVAPCPGFLSQLLGRDLTDGELVAALWRLVNIPYPVGQPIWSQYKEAVFERLPHERRLLAVLADVFNDTPAIRRVGDLLDSGQEDLALSYQLGVCARRDLNAALDLLDQFGLREFELGSNWWVHDFVDAAGDSGQHYLISIAKSEEDGAWLISRCFQCAPHLVNVDTLTFVARDSLSRLKSLRADSALNTRPIMDALRLFANAPPNLLQDALKAIDTDALFRYLAYFLDGQDKIAWRFSTGDVDNAVLSALAAGPDIYVKFITALLDAAEPRDSKTLLEAASLIQDARLGESVVRMAKRWTDESGPLCIIAKPLIAQARFRELFSLLMNAKQVSWIAEGVILPAYLENYADQFTDDERQKVLKALDDASDDDHRKIIIGRINLLKIKEGEGRLLVFLRNELTEASVRIAAAEGLIAIGGDDSDIGSFAGSVLNSTSGVNRLFEKAAELCLKLNDQEVKKVVRQYFKNKTNGSFSNTESRLLSWLVKGADIKTVESILAENSTRFVQEELDIIIRNAKANEGDESVVWELEDAALAPRQFLFDRGNSENALYYLKKLNPDTAFDIAANRFHSKQTIIDAYALWSLDAQRALDLFFEHVDVETEPGVVRIVGRWLNIEGGRQKRMIKNILKKCRDDHPGKRRLAVSILAWVQSDGVEETIKALTKDPDHQTAKVATRALRNFRCRLSAQHSREAIENSDHLLAFLHLNHIIANGDWRLVELSDQTGLALPDVPLFGSLHAEDYLLRLLRRAKEAERAEDRRARASL